MVIDRHQTKIDRMKFYSLKSQVPNRGFTLVELILVIALIALLSVVALGSYLNSSKTFQFISHYKNLSASLRQARSMAITNAQYDDQAAERYIFHLGEISQSGSEYYNFGVYLQTQEGTPTFLGSESVLEKNFLIPKSRYELKVFASSNLSTELELPLNVYYEKVSGEFSAYYSTTDREILKTFDKYLILSLQDLENPINQRYVLIYQVSGLPEEFINLPSAI